MKNDVYDKKKYGLQAKNYHNEKLKVNGELLFYFIKSDALKACYVFFKLNVLYRKLF